MRHVAAHTVTPVDTTGAGDAFIGSFATFLAGGYDEQEAIERANVYAALSTLAVGTQMSFVTLERFEEEWAEDTWAVTSSSRRATPAIAPPVRLW